MGKAQASRRTSKGFTIVELIVVIVVIAILAAITIVSYNSVRIKSENARTVANVKQYVDAITLYKVRTGSYPPAPNEGGKKVAMVCLGTGYPAGTCGTISWKTTYESSTFMSELQRGSGADISNIVNAKYGVVGGESFTGAAYGTDLTDEAHSSTLYARTIQWFLTGEDQDCGVAKAWAYRTSNGNTACELDFEEIQ